VSFSKKEAVSFSGVEWRGDLEPASELPPARIPGFTRVRGRRPRV